MILDVGKGVRMHEEIWIGRLIITWLNEFILKQWKRASLFVTSLSLEYHTWLNLEKKTHNKQINDDWDD